MNKNIIVNGIKMPIMDIKHDYFRDIYGRKIEKCYRVAFSNNTIRYYNIKEVVIL